MRSEKINTLLLPISSLKGVGPKLEILFAKLVGTKFIHLIFHLPYNVINRKKHEKIHQKSSLFHVFGGLDICHDEKKVLKSGILKENVGSR